MPRTGRQIYSEDDIAGALLVCDGSVTRAAQWLGCSLLTVRNRIARSERLQAVHVPGRAGRPGSHARLRIVSNEQIVAALDGAQSVKGAGDSLGVDRQVLLARATDPAVAAALTRCEQRWLESERARAEAKRARRRAEIADTLARAQERIRLLDEMRVSWRRARDGWIAEARSRGLSLMEMGRILGVTRERVRQIEADLGMDARLPRKRGRAAA